MIIHWYPGEGQVSFEGFVSAFSIPQELLIEDEDQEDNDPNNPSNDNGAGGFGNFSISQFGNAAGITKSR